VEIPKPDGGVRKLGIPTVLDRFVQQAVLQVLQRRWDGTFSPHSYGFRPGRSAHQAVAQAQRSIADGYDWVVDLDLLGGRFKTRNLSTAQMPHFPTAAETGEFYFDGSSARKSVWTLVRQLRGPHLSTCA